MGLSYLNGKTWYEVTRDERFFCSQLYSLILNNGIGKFISYINEKHRTNFNTNAYWEIGYEVCFYRDLWQLKDKKAQLFSPKRTFDLCLFSEESIIIIEAKSDQKFEADQLASFDKDKKQILLETSVKSVFLFGLISSKYQDQIPSEFKVVFNGPIMTWEELSAFYNNDTILKRADDIFDPDKISYGKNNKSGYMTGLQLQKQFFNGKEFIVGRTGGLRGPILKNDIESGGWKNQKYETDTMTKTIPNNNWFQLSDFIKLIEMQ